MDQDAQTPQGLLDLQRQSDEAASLARRTQAEHLADIRKEYGDLASSKARQDYRQKVMEERANAKDEARRNRDLLMAQMFADMATRPGPVLVAMMGSVKDRLPDVIANEKDLKKAQREMDRVVFELDEATRLEERGLADKAYARKEDALKRVNDLSVRYATQSVELEKSREASRAAGRRAFAQERGATERTQMEVAARERGTEATERARELSAATNNLNNARTNLANAQAKASTALSKNQAYVSASTIVNQFKDKSDLTDEQKRLLANSRAFIDNEEAKMNTALAGLVADVNDAEAYFKSLMPQRATQARQQSDNRRPLTDFDK
jgi:soluble cytochrome b562